jgi:hypothetical protein
MSEDKRMRVLSAREIKSNRLMKSMIAPILAEQGILQWFQYVDDFLQEDREDDPRKLVEFIKGVHKGLNELLRNLDPAALSAEAGSMLESMYSLRIDEA